MDDKQRKTFLDRLYRKYYRSLFNKCFAVFDYRPEFRQLAEDCVQETFVRALKEADALAEHPEPLFWLLTTCSHIAMSERRKLRRRRQIAAPVSPDVQEPIDPRDAIADWIAADELLDTKEQLMAELTPQERQVYHAVYEEGLPARETAEQIGTTEGGVYSALRRIKKKILRLFLSIFLWIAHRAGS